MLSYMYAHQSFTFGLGVNTQNFTFMWLEQFTRNTMSWQWREGAVLLQEEVLLEIRETSS